MKNITYISAGAGSGKTTEIVKRLVNALENNGVQPSQIIMTTFTRAAAQEMRERAKKELLKQAQLNKELLNKANEIDAAMIGTIHSVCLSFLQKYWYLAGISPDTQQMEENDFQFYVDRSLFELVSEEDMQQFEQWRKQLNIRDALNNEDIEYWRKWLRKMVDKVRYYHINDLKESRERSIKAIEDVWPKIQFNQAEYDRCTQELIANLPRKNGGELKDSSVKLKEKIERYNPIHPEGEMPSSSAKDIQSYMEAWTYEAKRGCFSDATKAAAINIVNKLFDILEQWQGKYAEYKKAHKMLDFNDMEVEFCKLLNNDEVQAELKCYKLVMVDEFQDCNPMQIDIFSRISDIVAEGGGRSIWVGDPKQAIYGFRGTDTTLVKETSAQIVHDQEGCARERLKESHRSREGLVTKVNGMFIDIFKEDPFGLDVDDIRLEPKREDILGDQSYTQTWTWKPGARNSKDLTNIAYEIKRLIEEKHTYVQIKIGDKIDKRLAQYKDIAILVRKNATVSKFAEALKQCGVPFFATEDKDKDSTPIEDALLIELIQYKLSPDYRPHLRADILHLLKDISTKEILTDYLGTITVREEDGDKHKVRIYDGRDGWKGDDELIRQIESIAIDPTTQSVYDTMAKYVDRLNLYGAVAKWGNQDIRQSHISRMLKLAQSYDQHCEIMGTKPIFADFTKYLDDAEAKSELNMDSDTVKILTMHKSKGLEWPLVIYYDADNDFTEDNKIVEREFFGIREQRKGDKSYWLRVFPTLCSNPNAQLFASESYFEESKKRVDADEERLHYVGVTRARDMLIEVKEDAESPTHAPEQIANTYQLINTAETHQTGSELSYLVSPSKNTSGKRDVQTDTIDAKRISLTLSDEELVKRMDIIGSCIHNIYAAYDSATDRKSIIDMAADIISSYNLSTAIKAEDVVEAIESLYKYLKTQYGQPTSVAHEVPFSIKRENGQLLRGEIDLLWHTPDGVVLVDYKNTKKEEANPEHYAGQMAAYREAIEASGLALKGIVLFYATLGKIINLTIH